MKPEINTETPETVQTGSDQAVAPAAICSQFLPCPFCGSTNIEVMYDDGYNVGCKDCSTYVAPFLGDEADDKQKHIDFWNTRAPISSANRELGQTESGLTTDKNQTEK